MNRAEFEKLLTHYQERVEAYTRGEWSSYEPMLDASAALLAAFDALAGKGEPVAWMYDHEYRYEQTGICRTHVGLLSDTLPRHFETEGCRDIHNIRPLYLAAQPAPAVDVEAIRDVAEKLTAENRHAKDHYARLTAHAERLLAAIAPPAKEDQK